jgi:hypothetical protein
VHLRTHANAGSGRHGPILRGYAAIGQLFFLDLGIKLHETGGWVQLRLRYPSASGLQPGATAWLPTAGTTPSLPDHAQ